MMDIYKTKENLQNRRKAQVFKGGGPKLPEVAKNWVIQWLDTL